MIRYLLNLLSTLIPTSRLFGFKNFFLSIANCDVESNVRICSPFSCYGSGKLILRSGTWISQNSTFYTTLESKIFIGRNCDIGPSSCFLCGTHLISSSSTRRAGRNISKDINIEDGVWIGANVTILPGVTIGTGAVIAAGSVVYKDIPANVMAAGNPIRIIKSLS
jgi:maltose O-acetyltransferase